tara:strand:- start:912 stop:1238 length:327 start_codon:yes stop_codon:yes gene_type:complete
MKKDCVNGWSNYQTWKINNEILVDIEFDHPVTCDYLEKIVNAEVFRSHHSRKSTLMESYARSFISEVNFEELADAINSAVLITNIIRALCDNINVTNKNYNHESNLSK